MRGRGRNVRRNLAPVSDVAEVVKVDSIAVNEAVKSDSVVDSVVNDDSVATSDAPDRSTERKNSRRGPNRRRPRNPNYKRVDHEGGETGSAGHEGGEVSSGEAKAEPVRSYDNDFAQRVERRERAETQAPVQAVTPAYVSGPAPVIVAAPAPEPRPVVVELTSAPAPVSAPKAVESFKQDIDSE